MKFIPVTKDRQRKATMTKSLGTIEKDEVIGPALVAVLPIDLMKQTLLLFGVAIPAVKNTFAARRNGIAKRDQYLTMLETTIRDFWAGLTRRHQRLGLEPGDLAHYRLPTDTQGLNITRKEEWVHIGEELVQGEEQAIQAGLDPMANPSIGDISAVLADLEGDAADVDQVDRAYQKAQTHLKELRLQIDGFLLDMAAELRHILRKQEGPDRRRSMRRFGFYFGPNGETELSPVDPEESVADVESEPASEPQG